MSTKVFTLEKYLEMHNNLHFDKWLANRLAEGRVVPDEWVEVARQQDEARRETDRLRREAKAKKYEASLQLPLTERYQRIRQQDPEIAWRWGKNEILRHNEERYTAEVLSLGWSDRERQDIVREVEQDKRLLERAKAEKLEQDKYKQKLQSMNDEELEEEMESNLLRTHDISTPDGRKHVIDMLLNGDEDVECQRCGEVISYLDSNDFEDETLCCGCYEECEDGLHCEGCGDGVPEDEYYYRDDELLCDGCYEKWHGEVCEEANDFADDNCDVDEMDEWPAKMSFESFVVNFCGYSESEWPWNDDVDERADIFQNVCLDVWKERFEELYGPQAANWSEEQELLPEWCDDDDPEES